MTNILTPITSLCTTFVNWFDGAFRHVVELVTQLANVAIRVLLAYGLYALVVEDLLLKLVEAF